VLNLKLLVAALAVAALTARLGVWQLDRAEQKIARQQLVDARSSLPPLTLPELARTASEVPAQQQRRVRLQGEWLNARSVYLDNRPMAGRTGFYLVTPLRLPDNSVVLVQRGWLPRDAADRTHVMPPPEALPPVQVEGHMAPALARLYEFDAAASGTIRQNLALDAFAREAALPLRPWVLIQDDRPGSPADGLLRQWPPPDTGVSKHHGYAFQWFSLCALTIGLYVWFQFIHPRRSSPR
jgi:surfeit locus 1 family protein